MLMGIFSLVDKQRIFVNVAISLRIYSLITLCFLLIFIENLDALKSYYFQIGCGNAWSRRESDMRIQLTDFP